MIIKNVKLYLGDGFPVRIPVSQYDTMWQFVFEIIHNSQPWQIPTGATAVLNGKKPDENVFAFSGTIENNTVTVDADVQMTAVAGQTVCELSILADDKTVGTANFILDVEEAPKSADDVVSDTVLDGYGMMVTNAVDDWMNSHSGQIGGLTNEAKQALLTLLAHVAYTDDQGQTYLDALETALYPPANLVSISAVFNQGDNAIYDTDSLDSLTQYLTVTATYDDASTEALTSDLYTLSGTLSVGVSTITVSYEGKTDTFTVTVTAAPVSGAYVIWDARDYTAGNVWTGRNNAIALTPTGNPGKSNGAVSFDGTAQHFAFGSMSVPSAPGVVTIQAAFKLADLTKSSFIIADNITTSAKIVIGLRPQDGVIRIQSSSDTLNYNYTFDTGWHLLTAKLVDDAKTVYIDTTSLGTQNKSFSVATRLNTATALLMGAYPKYNGYSNMLIRSIYIYAKALSDSDIANNYGVESALWG